MAAANKSGIQLSADGSSYIPASKRADGTTRKEIRVRPGYRPPEDVEAYRNRSAEAWKNRGSAGVPGTDSVEPTNDQGDTKSKNAKRREAAKKKKLDSEAPPLADVDLATSIKDINLSHDDESSTLSLADKGPVEASEPNSEVEAERQKKVRNQLKKLRAVRELKDKKANGEKLSHDQLMKIGKEDELVRDLAKLNYNGTEISENSTTAKAISDNSG